MNIGVTQMGTFELYDHDISTIVGAQLRKHGTLLFSRTASHEKDLLEIFICLVSFKEQDYMHTHNANLGEL